MGFSRKINDTIELVLLKQFLNFSGVRNITSHELVARIAGNSFQITKIACVRQQVVIHYTHIGARSKDVANEAGANKTRPTGYQKFLLLMAPPQRACIRSAHCLFRIAAELWIAAWEISSELPSN